MPAASRDRDKDKDTEITLGTGKMLALFFALVALCGVFFGVGFSLGKRTARSANTELSPAGPGAGSALRPPAAKPSSTSSASGMTFYKAVEQKDTDTRLAPAPVAGEGKAAGDAAPKSPVDDKSNPPGAENPPPISGYYVQVAAVSKQEDAESLVDALKKKQYPAFGASVAGDNLFHVQVGPFSDIKEAEAMRVKLVSDGYNPILKK
jgi:cell division septation protein DedD